MQVSKPALTLEDLHLAVEDVDGGVEMGFECRTAMRVDEGVRIFSLWQRHHTDGDPLRQEQVTGAERRFLSGHVAVVQQKNVLRLSRDHRGLLLRQCGAE